MTKNIFVILALGLFFVLLAAPGCGGGNSADDDSGGGDDDTAGDDTADDTADDDSADDDQAQTCPDGPEFDFDMDTTPMVVPYPNNLYTVANSTSPTGLRVKIDRNVALPFGHLAKISLVGFLVDAINQMNGFSTAADLYVPLSVEPEPASLPDEVEPGIDDGVFLMVNDEASPRDGEFAAFTVEWKNNALQLRPYFPLREATHYLLVATSNLKPKTGECFRSSDKMARVQEDYLNQKGDSARYFSAFDRLESLGVPAASVLSISDFTTQSMTPDMADAHDRLNELAAEQTPDFLGWVFEPSSNPSLTGYTTTYLQTPIFQNADGYWTRDANGALLEQDWQHVRVLVSLPSPTASPQGQPYPIVLYGHGVGDNPSSLKVLAALYAQAGFAFAGLDFPCHGLRAPIQDDPTTSLLCYFDFFNPIRFRDNLRETITDLMWLSRAVKTLGSMDMIPEGGDGIPDFDVEHIYYTGISMGAINGGTLTAVDENIDAYVLASEGAKLSGIAIEGNYLSSFVDIAQLLDRLLPNLNAEDLLWYLGGMYQHVLDGGDPINFLPYTIQQPLSFVNGHVPQVLEVCPESDEMLGGIAGAYANRAAGWPQLEPYVWDVGGVPHATCPHNENGFYQFDSSDHFALWDRGAVGDSVRAQAIHFLTSFRDTGTAEIIDTFSK